MSLQKVLDRFGVKDEAELIGKKVCLYLLDEDRLTDRRLKTTVTSTESFKSTRSGNLWFTLFIQLAHMVSYGRGTCALTVTVTVFENGAEELKTDSLSYKLSELYFLP